MEDDTNNNNNNNKEEEETGISSRLSMGEVWCQLCSNRLDAVSARRRKELYHLAKIHILNDDDDDMDMDGMAHAMNGPKSVHAQKRMCRLLTWTLTSKSCATNNSNNNNNNNDNNNERRPFVCESLCALLCRNSNNTTNTTANNNNNTNQVWSQMESQLSSLPADTVEWMTGCLLTIVQDQVSASASASASASKRSSEEEGQYAAALSLLMVVSNATAMATREEWVTWWIQCALGGRAIPSASAIRAAAPFLWSSSYHSYLILPAVVRKLRAHPEACLEAAVRILQCFPTTNSTIDVEVAPWLSCVQWKSTKAPIRSLSTQLLNQLLVLVNANAMIVTEVCQALSSSKKNNNNHKGASLLATLTTPDHRQGAYETLCFAATTAHNTETMCDAVLTSLTTVLSTKEVSSTAGSAAQRMGWTALLSWMTVSPSNISSAYQAAISFWIQQLMSDFRSTVPFLLSTTSDNDDIMSMESLWSDMLDQDSKPSKLPAFLKTTLENAQKKHSKQTTSTTSISTMSTAQLDGLLACYLTLLPTTTTTTTTTTANNNVMNSVMEVVDKVVGCGSLALDSSKVQTSFFYSSNLLTSLQTTTTNNNHNHNGSSFNVAQLMWQTLIGYSTTANKGLVTNNINETFYIFLTMQYVSINILEF